MRASSASQVSLIKKMFGCFGVADYLVIYWELPKKHKQELLLLFVSLLVITGSFSWDFFCVHHSAERKICNDWKMFKRSMSTMSGLLNDPPNVKTNRFEQSNGKNGINPADGKTRRTKIKDSSIQQRSFIRKLGLEMHFQSTCCVHILESTALWEPCDWKLL